MNFETYMLRGLFVACFGVCALIMGAMLTARPQPARTVGSTVAAVLLSAPTSCAMRPDGVVCPVQHG
jgi:hypothetical protein